MKSKYFGYRNKIKGMMGMYHETIDKARFLAKIFLPLHRKLRNIYKKKRSHQAQIKKLKEKLQPFIEELAKRNLDMLAKVATRRSYRVKKMNMVNLHNHH
jgi:uncharacterized protein YaaN involved in tellurite resistance